MSTLKVDEIEPQSGSTVTIDDLTAAEATIASATISGGAITGITDLAVADGGTGASTAAGARTNLSVYSTTEVDALITAQIPDSIVDAKGDLIVGTAADTPARLAVGTDGAMLVAASGQTSGLQWATGQYRLISITRYTTGSGTHSYNALTKARFAKLVGGGGGGGGADGQGSGTTAMGIGGGGGGYVEDFDTIANVGATESYSVGAGGSGGAAGSNNGTAGGDTTLGTLTGGGGAAGTGVTGSAGNSVSRFGANGGSATGGDLNISGGTSEAGLILGGYPTGNCRGGSSMLGIGGAVTSNGQDGATGSGFGAGGSGGIQYDATTNRAGGNGTGGYIEIWEFA